jgi:hypothetical protein
MLPACTIDCPYCGEPIELIIDDSIDYQEYIEDCSVCCRPIEVAVTVDGDRDIHVGVRTDAE